MITRRRAALMMWCCVPLVVASCGAESANEPSTQPAAESTLATTTSTTASTTTASTAVASTAVASTATASSPTPPEATMPTIDRPSTPEPSTSSNLEIAMADLRTRVGADVEIEVISNEEVTWTDGGLGCPEPGMSYTQALVDGERIVLRANGVDYEYHSGKGRPAFFCPPERLTPPGTGSYGKL